MRFLLFLCIVVLLTSFRETEARLPDKAFRQRQSQYIQRVQRCPWCGFICCPPNYCQGLTCQVVEADDE
uniref:Conotoxin n=1 Tax=Conus betulinus TaxID=89764 RepID=A0A142C1M5_CONBE|nr:conotoxin [Conus betulinus]